MNKFILIALIFLAPTVVTVLGQKETPDTDRPIEDVITSTKDKKQIAMLRRFSKAIRKESDRLMVTEYFDHYEIIAYHASGPDETGGVEQYLLDKKTGKWEMGWHEHPMKRQEYRIEPADSADSSTGRR